MMEVYFIQTESESKLKYGNLKILVPRLFADGVYDLRTIPHARTTVCKHT